MKLLSSAFLDGHPIPARYTCDGQDLSPPLDWRDVPAQTGSLALIVDDPDAPSGVFLHWLLFDIPASEHGLPEGIGIAGPKAGGGTQGENGFGKVAYGGPCPPDGTHRYYWHLYALDSMTGLPAGVSRLKFESAVRGHIIAEAQLMGRYARKGSRR